MNKIEMPINWQDDFHILQCARAVDYNDVELMRCEIACPVRVYREDGNVRNFFLRLIWMKEYGRLRHPHSDCVTELFEKLQYTAHDVSLAYDLLVSEGFGTHQKPEFNMTEWITN